MYRRITAFFTAIIIAAALTPAPAAATAEQDLQGRTVILDAGHGRGNVNGWAGYLEHIAMFSLAQYIKPLLEARGATVLMTRPSQYDVPLPVRTAKINLWALQELRASLDSDFDEIDRLMGIIRSIIDDHGTFAPVYLNFPFDTTYKRAIHPDLQKIFEYQDHPLIRENFLVISLHSNATGRPVNTSVNGADAFYISNSDPNNQNYFADYSNEHRSVEFGRRLLANIDRLGIRSRGTHYQRYHMIREHNLPAVLVENGFHTNQQDRSKLSSGAFLRRLALVYADTISDYFNTYEEPE
jgi:N-acetylmuramoyl-L-alanine amidase